MKAWHLEEGIYVARALQPSIREYGYHVTIGGSLINAGYSEKDLDLYFLPMGGFGHTKAFNQPDKLLEHLVSIWGEAKPIGQKLAPAAVKPRPVVQLDQLRIARNRRGIAVPIHHDWNINDEPQVAQIDPEPRRRDQGRDEPLGRWIEHQQPPEIDPDGRINAGWVPLPQNMLDKIEKHLVKADPDYDPDMVGIYKHAVTFYRNGEERIDCFIF